MATRDPSGDAVYRRGNDKVEVFLLGEQVTIFQATTPAFPLGKSLKMATRRKFASVQIAKQH